MEYWTRSTRLDSNLCTTGSEQHQYSKRPLRPQPRLCADRGKAPDCRLLLAALGHNPAVAHAAFQQHKPLGS